MSLWSRSRSSSVTYTVGSRILPDGLPLEYTNHSSTSTYSLWRTLSRPCPASITFLPDDVGAL